MVTPAGFEPAIFWMRTRCPRPLDEGAEWGEKTELVHAFSTNEATQDFAEGKIFRGLCSYLIIPWISYQDII